MNWAVIKDYMELFRTDNVMQQLQDWNVGNLSTDPWFLGGFAVVILFTYFMGWKAVSAFMTGLGGFAIALSWTVSKGTGTAGIESGGIYIIVGGGALVVGLFIYLLFIKGD